MHLPDSQGVPSELQSFLGHWVVSQTHTPVLHLNVLAHVGQGNSVAHELPSVVHVVHCFGSQVQLPELLQVSTVPHPVALGYVHVLPEGLGVVHVLLSVEHNAQFALSQMHAPPLSI